MPLALAGRDGPRFWGAPLALAVCVAIAAVLLLPARLLAHDVRSWEVVKIEGAALPALLGVPIDRLAAFRCRESACTSVPFQVDERDQSGHWVVDHGAAPTADDPPGILDGNDELLFMAADAGDRISAPRLPTGAGRVVEVALEDPLGYPGRWLYLATYPGSPPPRSRTRYVSYDESEDRIIGHRVSLGFGGGVPQFLSLQPAGANVLDRLKARATATLLWGLLRITRGDGDLIAGPVSWRAGPIRVIRRQQHAVRIGFGIRSPRFGSDTYFYRDFAEMPVSIRLRVPPRYFFTSISVRTVLDFRDLPGHWFFVAPGLAQPIAVDCSHPISMHALSGDWFALRGDSLTLVQRLRRSASLASVRQRLLYDADPQLSDPPEAQRGECPGVGFVLDDWDRVEGGTHALFSTSYAIAPDEDIAVFLATVDSPLRARVRVAKAVG